MSKAQRGRPTTAALLLPCTVPGCKRRFSDKRGLQYHMTQSKAHSSRTAYVCDGCGKRLSNRNTLTAHVNTTHCVPEAHAPTQLTCSDCDVMFISPTVLMAHRQYIHPPPSVTSYMLAVVQFGAEILAPTDIVSVPTHQ